ncbi:TetR/AcrR family transcriptional regulator [Actinotalea sp. M2MS4P-6]|uniref:TetR/AcrR family transcriptional regulator n=1 Tax=Actinotalea sp. M2MS4P-6 TaxID=2983762 RepID=UPI0021E4313B|nr:TetR/AcrR family transcriptional regulator [Actinotalea sp. M2MS4P-6]MCV2395893.1 TetR/AcrR family transcriptional regulator [Actinotalea sp. M2MS4P-6]
MARGTVGRPRDTRAHAAILEAVRELLTDVGYERLTIERVAALAGVGKQTVYRWWPSKSALVAEAVLAGLIRVDAYMPEATGNLATDVRAWLVAALETQADPSRAALVRGLAAAAADRVEDADRLYTELTGPARQELIAYLAHGLGSGQIRQDADLGVVADTLAATMLYRVLTHRPAPTPREIDDLVTLVVGGIGTRAAAT